MTASPGRPRADHRADHWADLEIDSPPADPSEHGSWLAHELRTPLTVLAGYLDLLLEGDPRDLQLALDQMTCAIDRLLRLADALTAAQQEL